MDASISRRTALGTLGIAATYLLSSCSEPQSGTTDYRGNIEFNNYDTSAGEYIPATRNLPAKNIPKPIKPQYIRQNNVAGLHEAIAFYRAAYEYAFKSGDNTYLKEIIIDVDKNEEFLNGIKEFGRTMWTADVIMTINLKDPYPFEKNEYRVWNSNIKVEFGDFYVMNGRHYKIGENSRIPINQDISIEAKYQDSEWRIKRPSFKPASTSPGPSNGSGTGSPEGIMRV